MAAHPNPAFQLEDVTADSSSNNNSHSNNSNPAKRHKPNVARKPAMDRIKTVWVLDGPTMPITFDFTIGRKIGEAGQFGQAYLCTRRRDGARFVAKEIDKARLYRVDRKESARKALLQRMQQEILIMRRLCHKHIVDLNSVYETKHSMWIVMEECNGGELFDRIREIGRFNEIDAAYIIKQSIDALYYMHEHHRVVHCDLKPDNILFKTKDKYSDIKIIDFGMSHILPRLNTLTALCGTPYYTAPEVIRGQYAHASDMWSIGVIMFVMLFGFPPFMVDPSKNFGLQEQRLIYDKIEQGFTPKVKPGFGPWFPRRLPISSDARDFMSKLLDSNEANRLVAKEALQHPWILKNIAKWKEANEPQTTPPPPSQSTTVTSTTANTTTPTPPSQNRCNNNNNNGSISTFSSLTDVSKIVNDKRRQTGDSRANSHSISSTMTMVDPYNKDAPLIGIDESKMSDCDGDHSSDEKDNNNNNNNNNNNDDNSIDTMINKGIVCEMVGFSQGQGFKYAVSALFKEQFVKLRPSHFNELLTFFQKLDTDGNGKVSLQEFETGMANISLNLSKDHIRAFFKELDMQNGGEIAFEEFLNAAVHDYLVANDHRLYAAFRELDTNDNGTLHISAIEEKLRNNSFYNEDENRFNAMLSVLKSSDLNGDGVIDYGEFLHALHPNFNEAPEWFWKVKQNIHGGRMSEVVSSLKEKTENVNLNLTDHDCDRYNTHQNGRTRHRGYAMSAYKLPAKYNI